MNDNHRVCYTAVFNVIAPVLRNIFSSVAVTVRTYQLVPWQRRGKKTTDMLSTPFTRALISFRQLPAHMSPAEVKHFNKHKSTSRGISISVI